MGGGGGGGERERERDLTRQPARPARCRVESYGRSGAVGESQGGRPGLSVLTSLMVSVDVKQH